MTKDHKVFGHTSTRFLENQEYSLYINSFCWSVNILANILMIEDNTFIGRVIQVVLEEIGHRVEWCKSGTEAFDALDSNNLI